MTLTANEQYFLELVNRARLDPLAEAARFGIDLNEGLAAGTLNGTVKQVLAPNALLDAAAEAHAAWMLQADVFSHTGVSNSNPQDRMLSAGYVFNGSWTYGENISWLGSSGALDIAAAIAQHHQNLFLSHGHRENILNNAFREVGIAQATGTFTYNGRDWNSSMAAQDFAKSGTAVFVTGAVYSDSDNDDFYSIGEGVSGTRFTVNGASATSQAAGGYALAITAALATVTVLQGGQTSVVQMDLTTGNGKLDLVDGDQFFTSASLQLMSGVGKATLLGVGALNLTGNAAANILTGNSGYNRLDGGDSGDILKGGLGNDRLFGGAGDDRLVGGGHKDIMKGGAGADSFVMNNTDGVDRISDFSLAQQDRLVFDDALWGSVAQTAAQVIANFSTLGAAGLVFNFGGGDVLTLTGLTITTGLAAQIDIF